MQNSNIQAIFDCVSMLRVVAKARKWCSILWLQSYSVTMDEYININKIAEIKGLTSNRSLRLSIQKGKYIAREVKVFGGTSYEILYSSLEPEVQEKLQDELIKEATQSNCTALVPLDTKPKYPTFIVESAKLTALARVDVVKALQNIRSKYKTKKEADSVFLDINLSEAFLSVHFTVGFGLTKIAKITECFCRGINIQNKTNTTQS